MIRVRQYVVSVLVVVALFVAGCGALVFRLSFEGERALVESDTLFDRGKLRDSLVYAERAASLYAPGLPHVRLADARIDAIAIGAESARMHKVSLRAWQAVRATELMRPNGLGRRKGRLELANRRLTGLLAANMDAGSPGTDERNWAQISSGIDGRRQFSNVFRWGQLVSLGTVWAGLVAAVIGIARRGLSSPRVMIAAASVVVGAIGFTVCLLFA